MVVLPTARCGSFRDELRFFIQEATGVAERSNCFPNKRATLIIDACSRESVASGHKHKVEIHASYACVPGVCHADIVAVEDFHQKKIKHQQPAGKFSVLHIKLRNGKLVPSSIPTCSTCAHALYKTGFQGVWLLERAGRQTRWCFYGIQEYYAHARRPDSLFY